MSHSKHLEGQEYRKNTKKRNDPISVPLSLKKIERFLKCSPTYIGAIFASSFEKMLLKIEEYSMIVYCNFHWLCIYSTKDTFEIFDPSGFLQKSKCFTKKFFTFLKSHISGKILYCNPKIQSDKSQYCGLYVIFYIKMRDMGYSFRDILRKFSKRLRKNDQLVKEYVEKIYTV